jgi:hypothetical protein
MTTTIDTGFDMLVSHLEITEDQRLAIVANQAKIESALAKGFDTHATVLAGAFSRNTMIAVTKDAVVDMFLSLRSSYAHQHSPAELLDTLHATLIKFCENTDISISNHGVVISLDNFKFNVVPSFHKEGTGYVIPDYKYDKWVRRYPSVYADQLKVANKEHKNQLLAFIKIIKCWNLVINDMFDEYYLELLVKQILTGVEITSYSKTIRHIFREARKEIIFSIDNPAGHALENQVQGLKDAERLAEAMICFHEAYKKMLKAKEYEHEGQLDLAYKEWESVFSGFFPEPLQMLIQELDDSGVEGAKALKIMRDRTS